MHEDDSLTMQEGYVRRIRMQDNSVALCLISKLERKPKDTCDTYAAITFFRQELRWIFGTGTTQKDAVESLVDFFDRYTRAYYTS